MSLPDAKFSALNTRMPSVAKSSAASLMHQQLVQEEYQRPPKCCGLCLKGEFLRKATIGIVITDVLLSIYWAWWSMSFLLSTNPDAFQQSFKENHPDKQVWSDIEMDYILIMLPIQLFLICKTVYGIRWIVKGYKRPALQSYYLQSWAFYTSYFTQETFLLMFSWDVFSQFYRVCSLIMIIACFPLHILLMTYMGHMDR